MHSTTTILSLILTLLPLTLARTDLSGCTSTTAGASIIYFVPGTGELCDFLDCGGGRAPPKTTVPGCPQYVGTATYSPSFLAGFGGAASTTSLVAATTSPAVTSRGEGGDVVTLTGTVSPSLSSTSSAVVSVSSSSTGSGASGSSIAVTSSTPTESAASQTASSASSSSSGSRSGSGTSAGTAAGATNTNAGATNAVNGFVGAVAAGIAFLL